jgi:hypothetical protein
MASAAASVSPKESKRAGPEGPGAIGNRETKKLTDRRILMTTHSLKIQNHGGPHALERLALCGCARLYART